MVMAMAGWARSVFTDATPFNSSTDSMRGGAAELTLERRLASLEAAYRRLEDEHATLRTQQPAGRTERVHPLGALAPTTQIQSPPSPTSVMHGFSTPALDLAILSEVDLLTVQDAVDAIDRIKEHAALSTSSSSTLHPGSSTIDARRHRRHTSSSSTSQHNAAVPLLFVWAPSSSTPRDLIDEVEGLREVIVVRPGSDGSKLQYLVTTLLGLRQVRHVYLTLAGPSTSALLLPELTAAIDHGLGTASAPPLASVTGQHRRSSPTFHSDPLNFDLGKAAGAAPLGNGSPAYAGSPETPWSLLSSAHYTDEDSVRSASSCTTTPFSTASFPSFFPTTVLGLTSHRAEDATADKGGRRPSIPPGFASVPEAILSNKQSKHASVSSVASSYAGTDNTPFLSSGYASSSNPASPVRMSTSALPAGILPRVVVLTSHHLDTEYRGSLHLLRESVLAAFDGRDDMTFQIANMDFDHVFAKLDIPQLVRPQRAPHLGPRQHSLQKCDALPPGLPVSSPLAPLASIEPPLEPEKARPGMSYPSQQENAVSQVSSPVAIEGPQITGQSAMAAAISPKVAQASDAEANIETGANDNLGGINALAPTATDVKPVSQIASAWSQVVRRNLGPQTGIKADVASGKQMVGHTGPPTGKVQPPVNGAKLAAEVEDSDPTSPKPRRARTSSATRKETSNSKHLPGSAKNLPASLEPVELDPTVSLCKQKRPPCNQFYLTKRGCNNPKCNYSHAYTLNAKQLEEMRHGAAKTACVYRKTGQPCQSGEECVFGHVCPQGSRCKQGSRCQFPAHMH